MNAGRRSQSAATTYVAVYSSPPNPPDMLRKLSVLPEDQRMQILVQVFTQMLQQQGMNPQMAAQGAQELAQIVSQHISGSQQQIMPSIMQGGGQPQGQMPMQGGGMMPQGQAAPGM